MQLNPPQLYRARSELFLVAVAVTRICGRVEPLAAMNGPSWLPGGAALLKIRTRITGAMQVAGTVTMASISASPAGLRGTPCRAPSHGAPAAAAYQAPSYHPHGADGANQVRWGTRSEQETMNFHLQRATARYGHFPASDSPWSTTADDTANGSTRHRAHDTRPEQTIAVAIVSVLFVASVVRQGRDGKQ
jgi:hypothetical protein